MKFAAFSPSSSSINSQIRATQASFEPSALRRTVSPKRHSKVPSFAPISFLSLSFRLFLPALWLSHRQAPLYLHRSTPRAKSSSPSSSSESSRDTPGNWRGLRVEPSLDPLVREVGGIVVCGRFG